MELGRDDSAELKLPYKSIGLKFIRLYWQQATPYAGHDVLVQNLGTQAAIIKRIADYRRAHPAHTLYTAQVSADFNGLLRDVTSTVKKQPIKYLQNLGGSTIVSLFDAGNEGITLLPGVAFCLRRFQPLDRPHQEQPTEQSRAESGL